MAQATRGMRPLRRLRQAMLRPLVNLLAKPLRNYASRFPNDENALKRHLQKGDVLLVEGSQRISEVIKYLTQSSWSHSALYIGDELIRRNHPLAATATATFGQEAGFLVVEALVDEGVIVSPVSKYLEYNIRLCRPHNLQDDDREVLLDYVVGQLGLDYDIQNILDLGRYFLPVSLVPRRFRKAALQLGSGLPTQVICSSLIASAFAQVGFPILPRVESDPGAAVSHPLSSGQPVFRRRHPTLITPRDFDLSPYFNTIKFNIIASQRLHYRNIIWAEDSPGDPANPAPSPRPHPPNPPPIPAPHPLSPLSISLSLSPSLSSLDSFP